MLISLNKNVKCYYLFFDPFIFLYYSKFIIFLYPAQLLSK
jgi:hypothetical protein